MNTITIVILIFLILILYSVYIVSYNTTPYAQIQNVAFYKKHYMFIKSFYLYLKLMFYIKVRKKTKYDFLNDAINRLVQYDITSKKVSSSKIATLEDSIIHLVLYEFLSINILNDNLWAQLHYKNKEDLAQGNFKIYIYDLSDIKQTRDGKNKFKKVGSYTVKEFKVNNGLAGTDNKVINLQYGD